MLLKGETAAEIGEAQKVLKLLYGGRSWPVVNVIHLPLIHCDAIPTNVAQKLDLNLMELTFLILLEQIALSEFLEDLRNMEAMFSQAPGVHQNVINVNQHEMVKVLLEHLCACSPGTRRGC